MANLLSRIIRGGDEQRFSADYYYQNWLAPSEFSFNGHVYPYGLQQTYDGRPLEKAPSTLPGYSASLKQCPPAFAAQLVRAMVLSQARFAWRNLPFAPPGQTPKKIWGNTDLGILEVPWTNGTTGDLIARMEWHAGLAGNSYVVRRGSELRVLRPDWVGILYGSQLEPEHPQHALDGVVIGYVYQQGGLNAGNKNPVYTLSPVDVAHWAPVPDPECAGIGMAWLTPAIREIQGDQAATEHKLRYFRNGATPNMVIKGLPAVDQTQFDQLVNMMEASHAGVQNAYRTLYLTEGVDATVVGSNLQQLDFKSTQGAGETRITALSRVPPTLLGFSEGLTGASLNAGNFAMARRTFGDTWVYPTLQNLCTSLAPLVNVPQFAQLWFDASDIPLLHEDAKDAADIEAEKAGTIRTLIEAGFTAESSIAAVQGQNMSLLKHTGLVSVQLQPPGTVAAPTTQQTPQPKPGGSPQGS